MVPSWAALSFPGPVLLGVIARYLQGRSWGTHLSDLQNLFNSISDSIKIRRLSWSQRTCSMICDFLKIIVNQIWTGIWFLNLVWSWFCKMKDSKIYITSIFLLLRLGIFEIPTLFTLSSISSRRASVSLQMKSVVLHY